MSESVGAGVAAFIDPSPDMLREQWLSVLARVDVPQGTNQKNFVPFEVVLCFYASLIMDYSKYGSASAHRAEFPVQDLARLFKRPPTSIIAKMANLYGTRAHGGKYDTEVAEQLAHTDLIQGLYLRILDVGRSLGVGSDRLPDFLNLEDGDYLELEGQYEIDMSRVENAFEAKLEEHARRGDKTILTTEKLFTFAVRVGQHRFAQSVLKNHENRCVFCGMSGVIAGRRRPRMLAASHIKPWRDSSDDERLDHRNGLAACPTHDVAFDTGLITVNKDLSISYAPGIENDVRASLPLRHALGKPPLQERIILGVNSVAPEVSYLTWHREKIYVAN
ncbi:HNH endonuclease [Rhodococcoides fascians]|jgi:putative restriction endonuclease|uniref:HNH endonuclease n=1 Tax=Rhodococcoides fascians TaxID=1828 RepID=UPI00050C0207|nr:HNH endonuclease [Rhodococcus fascians]WQH29989.1 HNH endonuclease [Rhodococcus fascians]